MTRNRSALAMSGLAFPGSAMTVWRPAMPVLASTVATLDPQAAARTARRLNRAAGVLAGSVLADSAVEH